LPKAGPNWPPNPSLPPATQDKIGSAVAKHFGIKVDYYGAVTALFAKLALKSDSFDDMVDDANEVRPPHPPVLRGVSSADSAASLLSRCTLRLGQRWRPRTTRQSSTLPWRRISTPTSSRRFVSNRPFGLSSLVATDEVSIDFLLCAVSWNLQLAVNLDGSLAKKVLGFKPKHKGITKEEVGRIVSSFQKEGVWPTV
jgi:hypothetical protein